MELESWEAETEAKDTDLCVCGHVRADHLTWSTATDCVGGPDARPCVCDAFEKEGP